MSPHPYVLVCMNDTFVDVAGLMVVDAEDADAAAAKGFNVILAFPIPKHPARPEDEHGVRFALELPRGELVPSHLLRMMVDHERAMSDEETLSLCSQCKRAYSLPGSGLCHYCHTEDKSNANE